MSESATGHAAFDQSPWPVACFDASGRFLAANAAFSHWLDAGTATLAGQHVSGFLDESQQRLFGRRWARFWTRLNDGAELSLRTKVRLADGRYPTLELQARLTRQSGETMAVIGLRDVTRLRETGRSQRRQTTRDQALITTGADATFLLGADRHIVGVSGSAQALFETGADMIGRDFAELLDPEAAAVFGYTFSQCCVGPDHGQRVIAFLLAGHADGRAQRSIEITLTQRLNDVAVRGVVAAVRDVTDVQAVRHQADLLRQRLRSFAEHAADLAMIVGLDGTVYYQSPAIAATLGLAPESTLGQPAEALLVTEDRALFAQALARAVAGGDEKQSCMVHVADAGGRLRSFWFGVRNRSADSAIGGLLVTGNEIGNLVPPAERSMDRQARRQALRERLLELAIQSRADFAQSLSDLLRAVGEMLRVDRVSFWRLGRNPDQLRCEALYDLAQQRFIRDWNDVELAGTTAPAYVAQMSGAQPVVEVDVAASTWRDAFAVDPRWSSIRAMLDVPVLLDGAVAGVLCAHHLAPRPWDEEEISFGTSAALLVSLALEASQRQQAEGRIEQLAWYDPLTGLPNRNLLRENLRDLIMSASSRRRRMAVMLIDLDRFKDVNDTLGHVVGDGLIKAAAQVLKETVEARGLVARLGGDEFVVVMTEFLHRQEVALLAAHIAQALHRTDLVPQVDTQVSASIGVALFPEHGREMSTLLKNADAAMYQAKRDGRNQFSFFNPIRAERAAREVELGIQLLKAVQAEPAQFLIEYQPQIELATGRVVGLEALIRWRHPTLGLLPPDRFIGVAEMSGLSERITRWVVNEVCAQLERWRAAQPSYDIPVSINVAGRELGSNTLPALVRSSLAKGGLSPRLIVLEITERTLVTDGEVNNDVLAELAALGVGLALDDFGTGYSTLGYLKRLPIQTIKIDQSFIKGVADDADSQALVHAMLAVARHFRFHVVAEGIEQAVQVDYLRSIGCEYAQGFYFSRPLPPEMILGYLSANQPRPAAAVSSPAGNAAAAAIDTSIVPPVPVAPNRAEAVGQRQVSALPTG